MAEHPVNVKFVWLQRAVIVQTVLLVLSLFVMGWVSYRFSTKQREMLRQLDRKAQENDAQEAQLKKQAKDIEDTEHNLSDERFARGLEAIRAGHLPDAQGVFESLLRDEPTDADAWRQLALVLIKEKQSTAALQNFEAGHPDMSNGVNVVTAIILHCATHDIGTAASLKQKIPASYSIRWNDKADYKLACPGSL